MDPALLATVGRWFDPAWYLTRNPDVARAGLDPLAHYLGYGEQEGRRPCPWFDPLWYRTAYDLPPGARVLEHFLTHRTSGAVLPDPALFAAAHLPDGRAAITAHEDPFDRYLTARERPEHELVPDLILLRDSGLIDADYHRRNGSPVVDRTLDPATHYCRLGWHAGYSPNDVFDPAWYARTNPDVSHLGINPLTHYVLVGEPANRAPVAWFDPAWYRAARNVPDNETALAHYLRTRRERPVSPHPLFDIEWYVTQHAIPADVDPFAHYLLFGSIEDIDPSPRFSARAWRHRHMGPLTAPGREALPLAARNPLVHHILTLSRPT